MIDALKLSNVEVLFREFLKGNDLYPTLVGVDMGTPQSQVDANKQLNFANWAAKLEGDLFKFKPGYSPAETYMSRDDFCRAISKDFDLENIGHRLYFHYGEDKVDFVTLFMKGCWAKEIPFCVKFDKQVARKDDVVAYIEDGKLVEVAEVLQNIVEMYPQFAEQRDLPMSVVNGGWFGYAVEDKQDGSQSYNRKFSNCVNRAFFDVELFNKFRENFAINGSLTSFAATLYEETKQNAINSGVPLDIIEGNDANMASRFDDLKLQMALKFFSGDDRVGSGFVPTANNGEPVDINKSIMEIKSSESNFGLGVTPAVVLRTALKLIKQGQMSFNIMGEQYGEFINSLSNNIRYELAKDNLTVALPVELQGITSTAFKENQSSMEW